MQKFLFIWLVGTTAFSQVKTQAPRIGETGGPNLPAQTIGPDDLVALSVYDAPEFSRTIRVGPDGSIRLPMLKEKVKADGLLPAQLEVSIADALKKEQLLVDPFVTVTMVEYHSRPISIAGAVKKPVTFQAVGQVTLLDALTQAEGLSPEAGGEILISRPSPDGDKKASLVQRIPVKGLIDAADPELNVKLFGGEDIRVPEVGKIFVTGNVKRPGMYPVHDSSDTTVLKALALSEGLMPYAGSLAYIYRPDDRSNSKNEIQIDLKKILSRKAPDVQLQARDILYIPDSSGRRNLDKFWGVGVSTASGLLIWRH